jgi:membrane protease YdiL (CAAX protease family)
MGTGTWRRRGPLIALALCAGLALFIVVLGGAPLSGLTRALPWMPFVILFAAMNAFGEEMNYRAPQLGALQGAVGPSQALLMTAAYFGIGHFYGVPYGVMGVVMSFVLGWILGRSMLETKGLFWAWFIHFCMDAVIFTFMAAGMVTPGG